MRKLGIYHRRTKAASLDLLCRMPSLKSDIHRRNIQKINQPNSKSGKTTGMRNQALKRAIISSTLGLTALFSKKPQAGNTPIAAIRANQTPVKETYTRNISSLGAVKREGKQTIASPSHASKIINSNHPKTPSQGGSKPNKRPPTPHHAYVKAIRGPSTP